jgi:sulfur dioxygenase
MIFRQLHDPETASYTYLLGDPEVGQAILIDPVLAQQHRDIALLERFALKLTYVLLTSSTPQRIRAARALREATGARIVSRESGASADVIVRHGSTLPFGGRSVHVLETPGYSNDGASYLVGRRVFTGNALAVRSTGRRDAACADPARLHDSVTRVLFMLPPDTLVYPAHHRGGTATTSIAAERRFNPEITVHDRSAWLEAAPRAESITA